MTLRQRRAHLAIWIILALAIFAAMLWAWSIGGPR